VRSAGIESAACGLKDGRTSRLVSAPLDAVSCWPLPTYRGHYTR
jgi:hypothetical protein